MALALLSGGGSLAHEPSSDASPSKETKQVNNMDIETTKGQKNIKESDQATGNIQRIANETDNGKVLIDAPHIKQNPELPRGCEVTSLAMLLNHIGISVDKMTLAKQVKKMPFKQNGLRGHLNDGFVGNMYSFNKPGIGVYHEPIKQLAETYLPFMVVDFTGSDFNAVIAHLNEKRPVWVVVTSTFDTVSEGYWRTWQTKRGPLKITYKMHSVLVTGYDAQYIYANDPLTTKDRRLPRQPFIAGWEQMGKQAITLKFPF